MVFLNWYEKMITICYENITHKQRKDKHIGKIDKFSASFRVFLEKSENHGIIVYKDKPLRSQGL